MSGKRGRGVEPRPSGYGLFSHKHHHAPGADGDFKAGNRSFGLLRLPGVHGPVPAHGGGQLGQGDGQLLPPGVGGHIDHLGPGVPLPAGEHHAHIAVVAVKGPVPPGGDAVEAHVGEAAGAVAGPGPDHPVLLAEADHILEELEHIPVGLQPVPVQPGDHVVLTVGVVVAELGVAELVSGQKHGGPPGAHEQGEGVAAHPAAEGVDLRVVRLPLRAAVPAVVVVGPVGVVPAVGQVVLFVVAEQVPEGKAVVAGDEVHRGVGAALTAVHILRAHQTQGGRLGAALAALEVAAQVVPVAAVPLRPPVPGGEGAHLVEPPGVPGLGDELHVPQNGVEGQGLEQGRGPHGGAVLTAAQDGGQIEPEAVHAVGGDPVAQAVQNHLTDHRVVAVHGIAAAGEVIVASEIGRAHV